MESRRDRGELKMRTSYLPVAAFYEWPVREEERKREKQRGRAERLRYFYAARHEIEFSDPFRGRAVAAEGPINHT